ncbi:restriction endonuclease subunit S [Vibrio parahaemolyticus]|nr:restriction endonuclease subunit S [Vibrio parahaemolyticus]
MSFETATLDSLCELVVDCPHSTPKWTDEGIIVLRNQNIKNGVLDLSAPSFTNEEDYQKRIKRAAPKAGDIVFTREAPMGEVCMIPEGLKCCLGQRQVLLRPKSDVNGQYLFWALQSPYVQQQIAWNEGTGSTVSNVRIPVLKALNIPRIGNEDMVAKSLSDIASKMALNTQTNQTLEQMAQAIFKSWFVDFDPVKAKMNGELPEGMDAATASLFPEKLDSETGLPEGWKLSEIGDEVTVVGGGTPSKKSDDFWVDGHIHWTSPKDLSGVQDKVLLDTASKVTEAGLKKISSGLLPVDTVLLSSRAPVGYLALAKVPMAINQGYIAMKCEKQLPPEFVIQWCVHRMDEIKQRASGSTFAEISKKSFKPISVVVPSEDTLNAYQKIVKPLYDAITSNARQNEQLSSLRDTLLPKLLSGELSISD